MSKRFGMGCGMIVVILVIVGVIIYFVGARSYNNMVSLEESVKEKWSQVENVYQRRLDLIPNLVETVRGYAAHERETLTAVTEARSQAKGTFDMSGVLNNPQRFAQFQQAQDMLSSALQRLMVVVERYPDLKANESFLALQNQLEGTENRITVERKRFNEAAREYNIYIKQFPRMFLANIFGFDEKPYFEAQAGAENAPEVTF